MTRTAGLDRPQLQLTALDRHMHSIDGSPLCAGGLSVDIQAACSPPPLGSVDRLPLPPSTQSPSRGLSRPQLPLFGRDPRDALWAAAGLSQPAAVGSPLAASPLGSPSRGSLPLSWPQPQQPPPPLSSATSSTSGNWPPMPPVSSTGSSSSNPGWSSMPPVSSTGSSNSGNWQPSLTPPVESTGKMTGLTAPRLSLPGWVAPTSLGGATGPAAAAGPSGSAALTPGSVGGGGASAMAAAAMLAAPWIAPPPTGSFTPAKPRTVH